MGVVICHGKSPGAAANYAITKGIVESERARIVMIPVEKEAGFVEYQNRLLDIETAQGLLDKLGINSVSA